MMKTSRLVIGCSLLVGLFAYTQISMPRIAGATADKDNFGRVSFREMPVELLIRDTFRDSAQVTTLIGTDGDRSYILFDRSGFSGKTIVWADCQLLAKGRNIGTFRVSHADSRAKTMFTIKNNPALCEAVSNMDKKDNTITLRMENIFLK